jgi:hypothetical protein
MNGFHAFKCLKEPAVTNDYSIMVKNAPAINNTFKKEDTFAGDTHFVHLATGGIGEKVILF